MGRFAVVTLVFTVGIQFGDAAFHAVQEVGEGIVRARSETCAPERLPCSTWGNLTLNGLADRLSRLFRLERPRELACGVEPGINARD